MAFVGKSRKKESNEKWVLWVNNSSYFLTGSYLGNSLELYGFKPDDLEFLLELSIQGKFICEGRLCG
jgi:hypothetical protein